MTLRRILLALTLFTVASLPGRLAAAEEGVPGLAERAEAGEAQAQFQLAQRYAMGKGVAKDIPVAVTWFRKAAAQQHAEAEFVMGNCYAKGNGVEKNEKVALEWYKKSAEHGYAAAQVVWGGCYAKGLGIEKNNAAAFMWNKILKVVFQRRDMA